MKRMAFLNRGRRRAGRRRAGDHRGPDAGGFQRRRLQERRAGRAAARAGAGRRPAQDTMPALEAAVERGRVLGESCNLARELCNEPANVLTPSVFAERGAAIGREAGLHVEVLDEEEIARLQMGLLLGVARGSAEPPRVLVLRHSAPGAGPGTGARAGRQGHHLRHRRHLDQAGRRHGADEGRHGRRRRRHRRDAGDRAAEGADRTSSASCR